MISLVLKVAQKRSSSFEVKKRLTVKAFRAEHSHNMRHRVIEKWSAHGVPHWEVSRGLHEKASVLEGPHGVRPRLAARVDEATVDPARHFVYLQPHVFRATFHHLFPRLEGSFLGQLSPGRVN